jgi:predicted PurR-regulated permease PerM
MVNAGDIPTFSICFFFISNHPRRIFRMTLRRPSRARRSRIMGEALVASGAIRAARLAVRSGNRRPMQHARQLWHRLTRPLRSRTGDSPDLEEEIDELAEELIPTPIYIGQRTRIVLMAAIVIAFVWLAREAPSIPRLLMIGATVALILSFPVRLLERWMPRGVAIMTVVGSTVAFAIIGLILIIPFAIREITEFVEQVPEIAENFQALMLDILTDFRRRGWIEQDPDTVLEDMQGNLLERGQVLTEALLTGALDTLTRSFNIAITTFGVIFVATYLLIDIPRFKEKFVLSFSPAYRPDAAQLWSTIGESLSRYLAGLMVSILIQGIMATIGLWVLGIPYAVLLGVWMSVTAILPYVGAFLGAIPAVLVALTISWQTALLVVGLYVAINQIEANLITPRIQGGAVRVHPLIIFVAVIAGSEIAGFLGAVMAVPVLAVVRVLAEFLWVRLQIRQPQDTVFVALGGEDDDAETLEEAEATFGQANNHDDEDDEVTIETDDDTTVTVRSDEIERVTVRDDDQVRVADFRPRPTVRPRRAPRRHAAMRRSRTTTPA